MATYPVYWDEQSLALQHCYSLSTPKSKNLENNLEARHEALLNKIRELEKRVECLENQTNTNSQNDGVERARAHCLQENVFSYQFKTVQSDYYSLTLDQRAKILNCDKRQLCKSILMENIACSSSDGPNTENSRFYLVVVQYTAKLNAEKLLKAIRNLKPEEQRLSKKQFNFQVASEEISQQLTGFGHNAISPFGSLAQIPIVLAESITKLNPPFFWMGGGHVDVKLGMSVTNFVRALNPIIADVTEIRAENECFNLDN